MYRSEEWVDGIYTDNHRKYQCMGCNKQFILGEELLKSCGPKYPICPYCGFQHVELQAWMEDDQLEELSSDMGCLAIRVETEILLNIREVKAIEESQGDLDSFKRNQNKGT